MPTKKTIKKKSPSSTKREVRIKPVLEKSKLLEVKPVDQKSFWAFLICGLLFGYFLSKTGITSYNSVVKMFLLMGNHIYKAIGLAIAIGLLGFGFFEKQKRGQTFFSEEVFKNPVEVRLDKILGIIMLGAGVALTGDTLGTALVQLGEGKLVVVFSLVGISLGIWIYDKFAA
jgi:hypothetical protein